MSIRQALAERKSTAPRKPTFVDGGDSALPRRHPSNLVLVEVVALLHNRVVGSGHGQPQYGHRPVERHDPVGQASLDRAMLLEPSRRVEQF